MLFRSAMLKSMGATNRLIRNIFLMEGVFLSFFGTLIGFAFGIVAVILQQQFGLVRLEGGGSFLVDAYPVSLRFSDFVLVFFTILLIGTLASIIPAIRASRMENLIRGE